MKKLFIVTSLILAGFIGTKAQEVYVGAQYQSTDVDTPSRVFSVDNRVNTYGVNSSITKYFAGDLGVTGEIAGTTSDSVKNYSAMGGLTLKSHTYGALQPFVHVLAGFSGERVRVNPLRTYTDSASPAFVLGGGLDYNTGKRVNVRLIQVDYLQTRFFNQTQNTLRLGTGLVF